MTWSIIGRGATVLVVEDDPATAAVLAGVLESMHCRVVHAATGAQATARVARSQPDLIILDLMLPDEDGLVVCANLRDVTEAPILVCSATQRKAEGVLARALGAADFLAKPFSLEELESRVEVLLRGRRPAAAVGPVRAGGAQVSRTRQCAWCRSIVDETGQYRLPGAHKVRAATHGICPPCRDVVRADIEATDYAQSGRGR